MQFRLVSAPLLPSTIFLVIHRCAEKPLCKVLKKAVARIFFFYQCNHTEVWCLQGAAELGLGSSSTISMGQIISPYECHSVTLSCLTHSSLGCCAPQKNAGVHVPAHPVWFIVQCSCGRFSMVFLLQFLF